ncbi:MAG: hypothetical protein KA368_02960 [Acidobacteria bacterium]|nr:hypothetical protein [Acidobacteriota bacterium]
MTGSQPLEWQNRSRTSGDLSREEVTGVSVDWNTAGRRMSTIWQTKVSTHVFAPEAQRKLAGDEGFAESPEQREI